MLAVTDAVVVAVQDSMPDNVPGLGPFTIIPGNYVVLDIGDGRYAAYIHLQPGSVRVNAGDRVQRGQVLGRVGNSGTVASFAHLHFHLSDAPWPPSFRSRLEASVEEGLPYLHESFQVVSGCTCIWAECAIRGAERREFDEHVKLVGVDEGLKILLVLQDLRLPLGCIS